MTRLATDWTHRVRNGRIQNMLRTERQEAWWDLQQKQLSLGKGKEEEGQKISSVLDMLNLKCLWDTIGNEEMKVKRSGSHLHRDDN